VVSDKRPILCVLRLQQRGLIGIAGRHLFRNITKYV